MWYSVPSYGPKNKNCDTIQHTFGDIPAKKLFSLREQGKTARKQHKLHILWDKTGQIIDFLKK